jgi:hypothetical protein
MNLECIAVAEAARLAPGTHRGGEQVYRCPGHDDQHPSLSINPGKNVWLCGPCGEGGNAWALAAFVAGMSPDDKPAVTSWLRERGLLNDNSKDRRILATYPYTDERGELLFEVVRFEPKDFRQRRPDGNGGYVWDTKGVKRLPYNLPEFRGAEYIWIPEGEKDVENLRKVGLIATCNAGGAGKWTPDLVQYFTDRQHITILPDNDDAGRKHALLVARSLYGRVASLKILELPGRPEKGDVSDWLKRRDPVEAAEELSRLSEAAPEWKPASKFRIGNAAEALKPQPGIDWLFRDFLARRWISIWFGEPGCKKTWAILDQAVCLAMGKQWLGFHGTRSRVLIVDEESGERRLLRRLGDVMRAHGTPSDIPLQYVSLHGFNLTQDAGAAELDELISEVEPGLVIIDALADLMVGGDENLVKDTQPVFVRLRHIAEKRNCSFEVIHHVNRAGDYRGSSALKGAVDTMLLVESKPDSSLITFRTEKTRDVIIRRFGATAHFDADTFHLSEAILEAEGPKLGPSDIYVLEFLGKNGPAPIKTTTENADVCSPETARRAVYRLAERGLIHRLDTGGSGKEATYARTL